MDKEGQKIYWEKWYIVEYSDIRAPRAHKHPFEDEWEAYRVLDSILWDASSWDVVQGYSLKRYKIPIDHTIGYTHKKNLAVTKFKYPAYYQSSAKRKVYRCRVRERELYTGTKYPVRFIPHHVTGRSSGLITISEAIELRGDSIELTFALKSNPNWLYITLENPKQVKDKRRSGHLLLGSTNIRVIHCLAINKITHELTLKDAIIRPEDKFITLKLRGFSVELHKGYLLAPNYLYEAIRFKPNKKCLTTLKKQLTSNTE